MPYLLIRHKVQDYAKWKPVFDEYDATRKASGYRGHQLFRNANDPNETVFIGQWDDLEQMRQFAHSEWLRQAMQRAGVADQPDIYFLEELEHVSV